MKKIILISFCLLNLLVFAQTKWIAHKSHSGTFQEFSSSNYVDNFGKYVPHFPVKTVSYYKENSVIEYFGNGKIDTVYNHPYFSGQYTLAEIKNFYPKETRFIGFEKKFFNDSLTAPSKVKKNSFPFLLGIVLLLFAFLHFKRINYHR